MRTHPSSRRKAWSRFAMLVMAGLAIGLAAGAHVGGLIDRVAVKGFIAGPVAVPADPKSEKPTEEDLAMGAALAEASVANLAGCRALARRHQAGCRAFFVDRGPVDELFNSRPLPETGNAGQEANFRAAPDSEWPAELD